MKGKMCKIIGIMMALMLAGIVLNIPSASADIVDYYLTDNYGGTWRDAEKTADDTDDDLMCWAAAASNVLEWTGWGFVRDPIEGEMTNCDQMFEHINDHCNDTGGWAIGAWTWWFNGTGGPAWSVPGGGNFWPTYNLDNYYHTYSGNETLQHIDEYLSNGSGVAIGVFDGAHEITCWGFKYNDTVNKTTNPEDYYKGVYVTDSDDNKWQYSWDPPEDRLRYYDVFYNSSGPYWQFSANGYTGWHITRVEALEKNPFLEPDLVIYKSAYPDVVMAGEELFYNITVVNANEIVGGVTAYNVTVTDILPDGVTYIADTGGCVLVSGSTYNCSLGNITPGDSKSFTIKVRVDPDYVVNHGSSITNTASVISDSVSTHWESDFTNNEATVTSFVQDGADLALTKDVVLAPGPPWYAGTNVQFEMNVTNNGPITARNVVLKDYIPSGVTVDSVSLLPRDSCTTGKPCNPLAPLTYNVGNLTAGTSITVLVRYHIDHDYPINPGLGFGYLENDAVVTSDTFDRNNGNNRNFTIINVEAQANLTLDKYASPDPVLAGDILEYFYNVINNGPSTAQDVVLTDNLPNEVDFITAFVTVGSASCTYSATQHRVTCDIGDMDPNDMINITVRTRVHSDVANNTTITNQAEVSSSTPDPTPNQDSVDALVQTQADLEIQKTSLPVKASTGDQIKYTIRVINHGPSDAQDVNVTDYLPKGVSYEVDTLCNCTLISECPPDILNCSIGTLKAGETVEFEIWGKVLTHRRYCGGCTKYSVPDGTMMINEVYVKSNTTDPVLDNNYATAKTLKIKGSDKSQWYLFGQILFVGGLVSAAAVITYRKKRNHNH